MIVVLLAFGLGLVLGGIGVWLVLDVEYVTADEWDWVQTKRDIEAVEVTE